MDNSSELLSETYTQSVTHSLTHPSWSDMTEQRRRRLGIAVIRCATSGRRAVSHCTQCTGHLTSPTINNWNQDTPQPDQSGSPLKSQILSCVPPIPAAGPLLTSKTFAIPAWPYCVQARGLPDPRLGLVHSTPYSPLSSNTKYSRLCVWTAATPTLYQSRPQLHLLLFPFLSLLFLVINIPSANLGSFLFSFLLSILLDNLHTQDSASLSSAVKEDVDVCASGRPGRCLP